jgi:hypothetical protein
MSRIRVTAAGPAEHAGAALVPVPARSARAFQSRGRIFGSPGVFQVPAPSPAAVPQDRTGLAQGNHHYRSSDAPGYMTPAIYYERPGPEGFEHAPVSVFSDNQMPVPALTPSGLPAAPPLWVAMGRPRLGGQHAVPNPAVTPRYAPKPEHGRRAPHKKRRKGSR